ncbi:MAG: 16S rRNA processing protein RimM [Candidatus Krumholzibacteriota bacterium]|nr:16S rRNA processing protein RimM [Candidatus Krumholzibacteriota bacterium]
MSVPEHTPELEIYLGRLVKAFGIKGEVKFVGSENFWPEVFQSRHLFMQFLVDGQVESRPVQVQRYRPHGAHFVVRIEGIDDRDAAEAVAGGEIFVEESSLDIELPPRELPYQVVGKKVRLENGREIGTVASVIFSAAHPVYEVRGESGVVLIPVVPQFVIGRDDSTGEITIRPIPGLIDE